MKNILQYLEQTVARFPDKVGFTDTDREYTFAQVMHRSKQLAAALENIGYGRPIAILIDRNVKCIEAMFGTLYSGGFYTVLDVHSPESRISHIIQTLNPAAVIAESKYRDLAESIFEGKIVTFEETECLTVNEAHLINVRNRAIDTDPMYVLFTSGSSGVPKGTVLTHKSVLSYIDWISEAFALDENTSFGSQTPLYFSMSVSDLFSTVKCAGTYHIIPKTMFTFPIALIDYLDKKHINTIYWVPSAMSVISMLDAFAYKVPQYLEKILFAGEVMPVKHLNYWRRHLPDCLYANLFGPTETTDICTYYVVDRWFSDDATLPIGHSCANCDCFILKENNLPAEPGEVGELIVRGSFLASGYYGNPDKTSECFVQNPLNTAYPEIVYRTGDLIKQNEAGEFLYITRKDFQIKRQGYRIELGEIEAAVTSVDGILSSAAVFDDKKSHIVVFYESKNKKTPEFETLIKSKLPAYMYPDRLIHLNAMPYNANGKIDRQELKKICKGNIE